MTYRLLPATPADLPDIIDIYHAAFQNDHFIGQMMPHVPRDIKRAYDMHYYGREFEMSALNGLRFRKVVDQDGCALPAPASTVCLFVYLRGLRTLVAFAKWQYPYTLTPGQKVEKARLDDVELSERRLPEGSNRELYDVFFAALREKKAMWMDESRDYCESNLLCPVSRST